MILQSMLAHIEYLDGQIHMLDQEIDQRLSDRQEIINTLDAIPGIGKQSAQVIVTEVGTDMSKFPSASHLVSWAGLCPSKNESAGKKKRGKSRKGNSTLRKTLVQCARSAARTKNTYLSSMYARIAARRGANVAAIAVARTILESYYYMVRNKASYRDLGSGYLDERNKEHIKTRSVKRLESLGFKVTLESVA